MPPRSRPPSARLAFLARAVVASLAGAGALCLDGGFAEAEEFSVDDAAGFIGSTDPEVRTKAAKRLVAAGEEGAAAILGSIASDVTTVAWSASLAALKEIGPAKSLAILECNRSRWSAWGLSARAVGYRDDVPVSTALTDLLVAAFPPSAWRAASLKPAVLDDPFRVPPFAEIPVTDTLPSELAWADVAVRPKGNALQVDLARDGRFATKITTPKVIVVKSGASERTILVYRRTTSWLACSPMALRGGSSGRAVELLDVDQDGLFDGPRDLIRFGEGAFRLVREGPLGFDGERLFRFRIRREGDLWSIHTADEPEPSWLSQQRAEGMAAIHRWRHAMGFPLQRIDERRSRGCDLHCAYLVRNGTGGLSDHDEDKSKPEWTELGAQAGRNSSLGGTSTSAGLVDEIARTILHRGTLMGPGSDSVGVGAVGSRAAQWGGPADAAERGAPILFPGAGAVGVACDIQPEQPDSDTQKNFYAAQRGFPVYVGWPGLPDEFRSLKECKLTLWNVATGKSVPGIVFDQDHPYNTAFVGGGAEMWFVPDKALERSTEYAAQLTATRDGLPFEMSWSFRTR